ncbi:uncharacterized protein I303_105535 [Kwoniella dejecticola CBS 10117]|uniref:Serine/threonine protein kinase n=1 Tax=Kwoniella dejecticola CBS 10117 TaxID=1296121 RepID=A0A1A6A276_9TREE|nr:serine/threonine protein kinase [Kwoniella dejecticola CBS 10117]OBR84166.1 serine/threonine protein kinase [Kwoniella dejecticola CBS 10117]
MTEPTQEPLKGILGGPGDLEKQGDEPAVSHDVNYESQGFQAAPDTPASAVPWYKRWSYTTTGGTVIHNSTFYEVKRIPYTLSDRVMSGAEEPPVVSSPGTLIIADRVELMSSEDIKRRMQELDMNENCQPLDTPEPTRNLQAIIDSPIFQSLPLVQPDEKIHYAKTPGSLGEVRNLLAVKGLPYVLQIVGRTEDDKLVTIRYGQSVTEWIIDRDMIVPEEWTYQWVVDIVLGLQQLHGKGILHKDLSANNVLFERDHAILCDFEAGEDDMFEVPPECILRDNKYDTRSDVYQLGSLLWSIDNRNMPKYHTTPQPSGIFKDIMAACLAVNPAERPTLKDILAELEQMKETKDLVPDV